MSSIKLSICGPCGSWGSFPDLNSSAGVLSSIDCPLDRFYDGITQLNKNAVKVDALGEPDLMSLFVVQVVSLTETYFREILSGVINICPRARRDSADMPVNLGSVLWGSKILGTRIAFEHNSLAGSKSLKNALEKIKLLPNLKDDPFATLLGDYDKICELRHVIAHSSGIVSGKNAIVIGLTKKPDVLKIKINIQTIQDISGLSLSLCRAFHQELFFSCCKRWALEWKHEFPDWNKRKATRMFEKVWRLFYSTKDSVNIESINAKTIADVREQVLAEFKVSN